jgi:hypothetical protein
MKCNFYYITIILINFIALRASEISQPHPVENLDPSSIGEIIASRQPANRSLVQNSDHPIAPTNQLSRLRSIPGMQEFLERCKEIANAKSPEECETNLKSPEERDLHPKSPDLSSFLLEIGPFKSPPRSPVNSYIRNLKVTTKNQGTSTSDRPDNDYHITITRQQLKSIELTLLALNFSLLSYQLYSKCFNKDLSLEFSHAKRGILPTDVVGATFWGLDKFSGLISSGVGIVVGAFLYKKIKNWIDAVYESDTDHRIEKKLKPVEESLKALQKDFDEKFNDRDKDFNNLVDHINKAAGRSTVCQNGLVTTIQSITEEHAKLTAIFKETIETLEKMTESTEEQHPNDQRIHNVRIGVNALAQQVQVAQQNAEKIKNNLPLQIQESADQASLIRQKKEKPSNCCGSCKHQ